jgi:hypothetical protein
MLTRLGETGADAFKLMRIVGHPGITVSQRNVRTPPRLLTNAFERLDAPNRPKRAETAGVPTIFTTVVKKPKTKNAATLLASNAMGA